jgi:hypothetical protein
MERLLLIANQPLSETTLQDLVISKVASEGGSVHVVVTTIQLTHGPDEDRITRHTEHIKRSEVDELELARQELERLLSRLTAAGVTVAGEVGDADPMVAIRHAMSRDKYSEVLLCTVKAGASRWFHMDLPHRIMREFEIEVEWVETDSQSDGDDEHHQVHIAMPASMMKNIGW